MPWTCIYHNIKLNSYHGLLLCLSCLRPLDYLVLFMARKRAQNWNEETVWSTCMNEYNFTSNIFKISYSLPPLLISHWDHFVVTEKTMVLLKLSSLWPTFLWYCLWLLLYTCRHVWVSKTYLSRTLLNDILLS